jgi:hypothetical protein
MGECPMFLRVMTRFRVGVSVGKNKKPAGAKRTAGRESEDEYRGELLRLAEGDLAVHGGD